MSEEKPLEAMAAAVGAELARTTGTQVYNDLLGPFAKQLGKSLETGGLALNAILIPIRTVSLLLEKGESKFLELLNLKAEEIPKDRLQDVPPNLSLPILQNAVCVEDEPDLREMYANLLASAMDSKYCTEAHPAFAQALAQMTPDEAKIMKYMALGRGYGLLWPYKHEGPEEQTYLTNQMTNIGYQAGCEFPQIGTTYVVNLARLGLIEITFLHHLTREELYEEIKRVPSIAAKILEWNEKYGKEWGFEEGVFSLTSLGQHFQRACIFSPAEKDQQEKKPSPEKI